MSRRIAALWVAGLALAACGDDSPTPSGGGAGGSNVTDGASGPGGADGSGGLTTTTGGAGTGGETNAGPGPGEPCDVLAQDCADPAAPKCTVDFADPSELPSTCQPTFGSDMLGDLCERPDNTPGVDTCVPGLFCAFFGQPLSNPQTRQCVEDCNDASDCEASQFCYRLAGPPAPDARLYGVCADRCDPFDPAPCPIALNKCAASPNIAGDLAWACVPGSASGVAGDACMTDLDCAPLLACDPVALACTPTCDATHPCAAQATCTEGLGPLGLCLPGPTM